MTPRIEQILDEERRRAEQYDWTTTKDIVAAVSTAREVIERVLDEHPGASPRQLAAAVEASRRQFRELWSDERGYGASTLYTIARALELLD